VESFHGKVVRILYELSINYEWYEKVYADHISEDYQPIIIHSPLTRRGDVKTLNYNPDVWAEYKQGRVDVFEVWDSQSDAECVKDLLMAALTPKIKYLHIICLQKSQEEIAEKLNKIILWSLYNKFGKYLLEENPYIVFVPDNLDSEGIRNLLMNKLDLFYYLT
jgi:hypothetical protein